MSTESDFALTYNERLLEECIGAASQNKPRHCARHAFHHLRRAWALRAMDPEMAIFRAISAEEEAASALFTCLKERQYLRADKLNARSHLQKLAVIPFIYEVGKYLSSMTPSLPSHRVTVDRAGEHPILVTELILGEHIARPIPPLEVVIQSVSGEIYHFEAQVSEIGRAAGRPVGKELEKLAEQRTHLLYADEKGLPRVRPEEADRQIRIHRSKVEILLTIYCLVFPHQKQALLVQQMLDSFLLMLGRIQEAQIEPLTW